MKDTALQDREIRSFFGEVRASKDDSESRAVEGYAALFGVRSKVINGWFTESIEPYAFNGIIEESDVFCLLNHDDSRGILARSTNGNGSLSLSIDEKGLRYSFDAPTTALGDELLEGLKRGDIRESSFAFTVDKEQWSDNGDGTYHRTILKVRRLYDVSPVYTPAYAGTAVSARSLEEVRAMFEPATPEEDFTLENDPTYLKHKLGL